jgi:hypothetical protein
MEIKRASAVCSGSKTREEMEDERRARREGRQDKNSSREKNKKKAEEPKEENKSQARKVAESFFVLYDQLCRKRRL